MYIFPCISNDEITTITTPDTVVADNERPHPRANDDQTAGWIGVPHSPAGSMTTAENQNCQPPCNLIRGTTSFRQRPDRMRSRAINAKAV